MCWNRNWCKLKHAQARLYYDQVARYIYPSNFIVTPYKLQLLRDHPEKLTVAQIVKKFPAFLWIPGIEIWGLHSYEDSSRSLVGCDAV
jgi:hypothetical protein